MAKGIVSAFDPERGIGEIAADDGTGYPFHCTAIVGGGRLIESGARVRFDIAAGHHGRWEAQSIQPA